MAPSRNSFFPPLTFREMLQYFPEAAICIGLLLVVWGLYVEYEAGAFVDKARKVDAIVVQVDSKLHDGRRTYRPVFEIELADGSRKRFAGNIWRSPMPHGEGEAVDGWYSETSGEFRSDKMLALDRELFLVRHGISAILLGSLLLLVKKRKTIVKRIKQSRFLN